MSHIMHMLLYFYMHHTPNPNPRFELALEYMANDTNCNVQGVPYLIVDKNVRDILWKGVGPKCKEEAPCGNN